MKCLVCGSEILVKTSNLTSRGLDDPMPPISEIHTNTYQCLHALSERIKKLEGGR